jgi:hypothetical protein
MSNKFRSSNIIFFSVLLVFAIRLISFFIYDIYDDAFITFRYAQNLATGNGLVYNPGEYILGTTSPLFAIIIALIYKIGLPIPESVVILNIIFDSFTVFIISKVFIHNKKLIELGIFLFVFSCSVLISRITSGGMEVNLFLLLSILTIFLYIKEKKIYAFILCSLTYFVRPESISLIVILLFNEFFSKQYNNTIVFTLISIVTVAIPLFIIYNIYGNILPQSVLAKSELTGGSIYELINMFFLRDPISIITLPFALIGLTRINKIEPFLKIFGYWILLLIISYLVIRPHPWPWYSYVIRAGFALFSGVGIVYILSYLKKIENFLTFRKIIFFSAFVALSANLTTGYFQGFKPVTRHIYYPLQNWSTINKTSDKKLIADDIGIIGFHFEGYIYDTQGLVSSRFVKKNDRFDFFKTTQSDFLFLNSNQENVDLMFNTELKNYYHPIARYSKSGDKEISMNTKDYPQGWIQDYILFKRVSE